MKKQNISPLANLSITKYLSKLKIYSVTIMFFPNQNICCRSSVVWNCNRQTHSERLWNTVGIWWWHRLPLSHQSRVTVSTQHLWCGRFHNAKHICAASDWKHWWTCIPEEVFKSNHERRNGSVRPSPFGFSDRRSGTVLTVRCYGAVVLDRAAIISFLYVYWREDKK